MAIIYERESERFGRYEILGELGRGAMGVVYQARDPKINRTVAVKSFSLAGQPPDEERDFRERFFREAEAAGRISHPGIVTIFDVGEEPETRAPYIVMEYVGGQSLEKILSKNNNKLPLDTALQLAQELAEALDCAHSQGVVHRDLKPANILITEDGHAKIADFGVAKLNLANHTLAGRALGTPAYMSPEQLNGDPVDGRSDLFSLGVVLYTVLTGHRPFQGNSAMTVSFKVVNREPIPATVLDTQLPSGVDSIIARAMAKDPAQRYQRGMELAQEIQLLRDNRSGKKKAGGTDNAIASGEAVALKVQPSSAIAAEKKAQPLPPIELANRMQKSFANLLLLVGLAIFAMRIGPLLWKSRAPSAPRTTSNIGAALPFAGESAAPKPATADGASSSAAVASNIRPSVAALESIPEIAPESAAQTPPAAKKISPVATRKSTVPAKPSLKSASAKSGSAASPIAASIPDPATLEIEVEHKFQEAHLSIWVDDKLTYTHLLEGTDSKRLVVFHRTEGHEFHAVQIPPGTHALRVEVTSEPKTVDHNATISGDFTSGKEKLLRIQFDKKGEMNLKFE